MIYESPKLQRKFKFWKILHATMNKFDDNVSFVRIKPNNNNRLIGFDD